MKIDAQTASPFLKTLRQQNEARNDSRKQTASRKEEERLSALESLRNMPSASETRKAAARMRMEQLKAQLEALMKFSMGKVNPRLIAQLARELKSLVAQYGGDGGSTPAMPTVSANVGNAATDQGEAATGDQAAEAAAAAASAAAEAAESDVPSEPDVRGLAAEAEAMAKTASASDDEESGSVADPSRNERIGNVSSKESDNAADRKFFAEVKKLAQMIKALLKRQAREAEEDKDVKEAKKAVNEMDEAIRKAEGNLAQGQSQGLELTAYAPSGAAVSESAGSSPVSISIHV